MKNKHHFDKEPRDEAAKRDLMDVLSALVRPMDPPPKDENRNPTKAEREERYRLARKG